MHWAIGTGGTILHPTTGKISFMPLVTILVSLLVVRFVLGVRMTWPVVSAVVVVGIALGAAIGAWGVVVPSAVAFLGAAIVTGQFRRRRGKPSSA
jgi:hypothetical protein